MPSSPFMLSPTSPLPADNPPLGGPLTGTPPHVSPRTEETRSLFKSEIAECLVSQGPARGVLSRPQNNLSYLAEPQGGVNAFSMAIRAYALPRSFLPRASMRVRHSLWAAANSWAFTRPAFT